MDVILIKVVLILFALFSIIFIVYSLRKRINIEKKTVFPISETPEMGVLSDELLMAWYSEEEAIERRILKSNNFYDEMHAFSFHDKRLLDTSNYGYKQKIYDGYLAPNEKSIIIILPNSHYYWDVNIFDITSKKVSKVVSIRESDPGSGRSFSCAWSKDSTAIFIYGRGPIATNDKNAKLPLIYSLKTEKLFYLPPWDELVKERLPYLKEQKQKPKE